MKPLIGITVHLAEREARQGHVEQRLEVGTRYGAAVLRAGGIPVLVPTARTNSAAPADLLSRLDGLLLSGGGSLPASFFGENPDPSLEDTNPERYGIEVELVREAAARGLPVLGICRGHQTLSEAFGGTLIRNLGALPGQRGHYQEEHPGTATHGLRLKEGSLLASLLGPEAMVNSLHRQSVDVVPAGFSASAWSDDGLIEAVEKDSGFVVGVQFHPEWLADGEPGFAALFDRFVAEARAVSRR